MGWSSRPTANRRYSRAVMAAGAMGRMKEKRKRKMQGVVVVVQFNQLSKKARPGR
jgi:hypothetical protein